MAKIIKTKAKTKKKSQKPIVVYVISALKGFVVSFIGLVLLSLIFLNSGMFSTFTKLMVYVVIGLGALICGYSAHKSINGRGLVNGIIASLIYLFIYLIVLIISMKFHVEANILLLIPVCVIPGLTGGIISANR